MEALPNMLIRKSTVNDIDRILNIFNMARVYMRANNNPNQWAGNYPGKEHILLDIDNGNSYVGIDEKGQIIMTFAFISGNDPTYNIIDGRWLNNEPYGTIHRIASNGKKGGMLKAASEFCFQKINNIRIDTHKDNLPMLRALENNGFQKCGIIICADGTPRLAFQKVKQPYNHHSMNITGK